MTSVKKFFQNLFIHYGIMIFIPIALFVFCEWELQPYREDDFDIEFLVSDGAIIVLGLIFSIVYTRLNNKKALNKRGLLEKMLLYKKSLQVSWLTKSIIIIYSIVAYFMTGDIQFIYVFVFCVVILVFSYPSVKGAIRNLKLTEEESKILKNPYSAL